MGKRVVCKKPASHGISTHIQYGKHVNNVLLVANGFSGWEKSSSGGVVQVLFFLLKCIYHFMAWNVSFALAIDAPFPFNVVHLSPPGSG